MSVRTKLVLNPNKPGSIARVVVLEAVEGRSTVLNVDPLYQNPEILRRFNPGYTAAVKFWNIVGGFLMLAGIVLSFLWHWWAFLLGFLIAAVVMRANRGSVGDFAVQAIKRDPAAYHYFAGAGLIWTVSDSKVVDDTT